MVVNQSLNVLIVGAGAIGSLVGGKLAGSGADVTLVGRERLVAAVRQNGLRLRLGETTQRIETVRPVASLQEAFWLAAAEDRPYDVAVLTVKSYDTEAALSELAAAVETNPQPVPLFLSLQNGVGNEEAITHRFGADKVIAGTITAPVEVPEPGLICVAKPQFIVGLARWDAMLDESLFQRVYQALATSDITVTVYADARAMKWTKLLMNIIGNATSAILAEPPGQAIADPRVADLEIEALREALDVMEAIGIRPVNVEPYPLAVLAPFIRHAPKALLRPALRRIVGGARGGKMPSLYLDLEKGKAENEVNWLNGAVTRTGETVGVAVPVNRALNEILLELARHPETWPEWQSNVPKLRMATRRHV